MGKKVRQGLKLKTKGGGGVREKKKKERKRTSGVKVYGYSSSFSLHGSTLSSILN